MSDAHTLQEVYFTKDLLLNIWEALKIVLGKCRVNGFVVIVLENYILINPHIIKAADSTLQIFTNISTDML